MTNLFNKFYTALKDGYIKDLVGLLNQLVFNTLIFELLDLHQGVLKLKLNLKLPDTSRNSKKVLINIKNNDQNFCFLWCHIGLLNQLKIHPKGITQNDKKLIDTPDYEEIEFPLSKNDFNKNWSEKQNVYQRFLLWKQIDLSSLHIKSKIWKFNGFVDNIR